MNNTSSFVRRIEAPSSGESFRCRLQTRKLNSRDRSIARRSNALTLVVRLGPVDQSIHHASALHSLICTWDRLLGYIVDPLWLAPRGFIHRHYISKSHITRPMPTTCPEHINKSKCEAWHCSLSCTQVVPRSLADKHLQIDVSYCNQESKWCARTSMWLFGGYPPESRRKGSRKSVLLHHLTCP